MHLRQSISEISILVLVPDEEERVFLSSILSLIGYRNVIQACSEETACQALTANPFQLIFLRLADGEPDPQQVLGKIFSSQSRSAVFVITSEGQSCEAFEKQAHTYGIEIAGCVDEPFSLSMFAQELRRFLSQQY